MVSKTIQITMISIIVTMFITGSLTTPFSNQVGIHNAPPLVCATLNDMGPDTPDFVVTYTMTFSEKDISLTTVNGFTAVQMQDSGSLYDVGKPMMPMKNIRVALPDDMKVSSIEILDEQVQPINGIFTIYPAQQPLPIGTPFEENQFVQPDYPTYASDQPYPSSSLEFTGQSDLAGQVMADITIYPLHYVPAENHLSLVSSITFSLKGTHGYRCNDYRPAQLSDNDQAPYLLMVKDMVINPEDVTLRTSPNPQPMGVQPGDYDYVIITQDSWVSAFQPLADWKTQKGVPTTIVTTNWIYNSGGYSGTNAQKIRAFVQDAYNTWGTTYVLLGGDIDVVPCNYTTFSEVDSNPVPNDAYYADFDSDWICEVNVGRASVNGTGSGTGRIGNFINKVLTYEKNPPLTNYAQKVGLFGFDLDTTPTQAEQCKININNTYIPTDWKVTTVYDSQTGNHRTNVIAALNAGQNIVNHADHSNNNCMGTGYVKHSLLIYNSDMDALTNGNKQTILYSMGCDPAAYDVSICIAEHFVRNSHGGGMAFIGNSRYGWYSYGSYDTYSMGFDVHFFKSLFQENLYNLGAAFSDHKNDGYQDFPGFEYYQYIFTELTLLGDPELPVWTANPMNLTVVHSSQLPVGTSSFTVTVTANGTPVNQAYICLWKGNEVYERGSTDATGNVTFTVSPTTEGVLTVTVTKHNYLPNESTAQVTGNNLPPYQPSSPTPANNTTTISLYTDLSWTGGDPNQGDIVTYDVYFGTSSNPPMVTNNQSGTTYDPGTLSYFTAYYWKIVAWDNNGASTVGSVWSFTTKANSPPVYGTPSPINGSSGNPLLFTWSIPINDSEGNIFTWTIQCNNSQTNSGTGATNGSKTLLLTGLSYSKTYKIWVNATDPTGSGTYTRKWYTFTTKTNLPPTFGTPNPTNGSTNNPLTLTWNIPINDPEGDPFSWTLQCSNGQTNSSTGASNGTKSLTLLGLAYTKTYKVWVNATDLGGSGTYTRKWYAYTTKTSLPPVFGIPIPSNGSINNSLSFTWSIPISDPEGDSFDWAIQCSNGQTSSANGASNGSKTLTISGLAYATTYKIWVNATDPTGSNSYTRKWYNFTTQSMPPDTPPLLSSPQPANGSINIAVGTSSLSITIQDPEDDLFNWSIITSPDIGNSSGANATDGTKTCSISGLTYTTYYSWVVSAYDGRFWTNQTFSFTTVSNGGGGGGGSPPPIINYPPMANVSAGEPYQGDVNTSIIFDGSKSSDSDGNITKWFWVFGDKTNGTGKIAEHVYSETGTYTVTLTVTDNEGAINTDTTTCMITPPNRPPTKPSISGPTQGTKNTNYNYIVTSTDADNDTVRYFIIWGDETSYENTSTFLPSGTPFTCNHRWTTPGIYTITVHTSDNKTDSELAYIIILIDVKYTENLGYLIDQEATGVYDGFYSNSTVNKTSVQRQANGTYLIDTNGDGNWEYWYNETTTILGIYQQDTMKGASEIGFFFVIAAMLAAVSMAVSLVFLRRQRKQ